MIPLGRKILVEDGIIDFDDQKFHINQLELLHFNFHCLSHNWHEALKYENIERENFNFLKPIFWQVFLENPEIIFNNFGHLIKNHRFEQWAFPFSERKYFRGTTFSGDACNYYDSLAINFTAKKILNQFIEPASGDQVGRSATFYVPYIRK